MLEAIKEQIENQLIDVNQSITLEEIELLGRTKIAVTISTPHLMGSIEILEDLTTDLLIIEFDNEELVYSESFDSLSSTNELIAILSTFLKKVCDTEKNY